MLDAVVAVFDKVITRPSFRSVLLVVLVFGTATAGLVVFEAYTAYFRLQRLVATADLLSTMQRIESAGLDRPEVARAYNKLSDELRYLLPAAEGSIISPRAPVVKTRETLWKFVAGGVLWWAVSLVTIGPMLRREKSSFVGFIGIVVFGIVFGGVGAALPTIYWPWFNLVLYPIGHFSIALLAIAGFTVDLGRNAAPTRVRAAR